MNVFDRTVVESLRRVAVESHLAAGRFDRATLHHHETKDFAFVTGQRLINLAHRERVVGDREGSDPLQKSFDRVLDLHGFGVPTLARARAAARASLTVFNSFPARTPPTSPCQLIPAMKASLESRG